MDSKAKKAELEQLRQAAVAKLAEVKAETTDVDARAIEVAHSELLAKIAVAESELRSLEKAERAAADKKRAKDKKDNDEDEDEDGDEDEDADRGDEEGDDKGKRTLKPSEVMAMSQFVVEARSLGVELDMSDFIKKGQTVTAMRKAVFADLAKKSNAAGPRGTAIDVGTDHDREGKAEAMEIALITRVLGSRGHGESIEYKPKDKGEAARVEKFRARSEQYLGMGLVDIAAACIDYKPRHSSRYLTAGDANYIFERAFNSTSDFPNIFMNVLNKSLLARYELHTPTYRELAVERPFNDFRPHPQIRAGEFPTLQPVSETGELKYGSSADLGEFVSVNPYGVVFTISRTMLVNDDLGAIDQILGSAGDTVLIFENTTFFNTVLLANGGTGPTLNQDGLNVFNATAVSAGGHGNYLASGQVPGISSIGVARQALRQMKSVSGLYLNVPPCLILTGPATETVADQMVTAITPTLTTSVNPFSGRLRSVSDANITDASWYVFTEPSRVPNFIYGFLNGANGPRVRTYEPFGVQGVKISLEHDFGVGAIDYRGAYLNHGA